MLTRIACDYCGRRVKANGRYVPYCSTRCRDWRTRCCPICRQEKRLVRDHCHATGLPRQPICFHCNVGLGMFQDDPFILRNAVRYLRRHREAHRKQLRRRP